MYARDPQHPSAALQEKLHRLYALKGGAKIELGFRPDYLKLLEAFGNPHKKLPPVIHVAGTNGKGSIIAILRALFEENDKRVHTYTSPHLIRFNERINIAGHDISDEALETLIDEALALNDNRELTFFEITTAMAFAAFARAPADICLLETGLGGRLDCTNVIERPALTVISQIGYDHMEFLGHSLPEIAAEKAGIMKAHAPCIIGLQNDQTLQTGMETVFESKAQEVSAPLFHYGAEWTIEPHGDTQMRFRFENEEYIFPRPNLMGDHQIYNAGTALAAYMVFQKNHGGCEPPIPQSALSKIKWKARLQNLSEAAQKAGLLFSPSCELWLDGGHNESASGALARQISLWKAQDERSLHLVAGMMRHKDAPRFLKPLLSLADSFTAVPIPGAPEALSPESLIKTLPQGKYETAASWQDAIQHIVQNNEQRGRILITGSLYLAGDVLQQLDNRA